MGQIIRVKNATVTDISEGIQKFGKVTRVDGYQETLANGYFHCPSLSARLNTAWGTTYTTPATNYPFPYASSDTTVAYDKSSITNQVGTCAVSFNLLTNNNENIGYIANITITGSGLQDETVNSIMFTRRLYVQGGGTQEFLLFAYILDSPITLNAGNNYTANLTMSVSFE